MITMCKILAYFKKKFVKFVNAFFLVNKGPVIKTWISSYLPIQEEQNLCFIVVHVYVSYGCLFTSCRNNHTQSIFLHRFHLYTWWRRLIQGKTYPVIDAPVHGKYDGASYYSVWHSIRKLCLFLFSQCLLYKSIFSLLLLCRAITPKFNIRLKFRWSIHLSW